VVDYGDGGSSDLVYPIYICEKLDVKNTKVQQLLNCLLQLGTIKKRF